MDARAQGRADVGPIAPDVAGVRNDLRVKDNQFVHKEGHPLRPAP